MVSVNDIYNKFGTLNIADIKKVDATLGGKLEKADNQSKGNKGFVDAEDSLQSVNFDSDKPAANDSKKAPGVDENNQITIQKWRSDNKGNDKIEGLANRNDCPERIAANYLEFAREATGNPDLTKNDVMRMIMQANPDIYGEVTDSSPLYPAADKAIHTGNKYNLPAEWFKTETPDEEAPTETPEGMKPGIYTKDGENYVKMGEEKIEELEHPNSNAYRIMQNYAPDTIPAQGPVPEGGQPPVAEYTDDAALEDLAKANGITVDELLTKTTGELKLPEGWGVKTANDTPDTTAPAPAVSDAAIKEKVDGYMKDIMDNNKLYGKEKPTIVREMTNKYIKDILAEYKDDPETADKMVTKLIQELDSKQGTFEGNPDKPGFLHWKYATKELIGMYQGEKNGVARLMEILNNSAPSGKAAEEEWSQWSLNRCLIRSLVDGGNDKYESPYCAKDLFGSEAAKSLSGTYGQPGSGFSSTKDLEALARYIKNLKNENAKDSGTSTISVDDFRKQLITLKEAGKITADDATRILKMAE